MLQLLAQIKVEGYSPIEAPSNVPTLQTNSISNIFGWGIGVFITAGILTAIGFIIYGGLRWITSGGDKQKIETARKTLMYTIIGLILMVVSLAIVKGIGDILGTHYF